MSAKASIGFELASAEYKGGDGKVCAGADIFVG